VERVISHEGGVLSLIVAGILGRNEEPLGVTGLGGGRAALIAGPRGYGRMREYPYNQPRGPVFG
jgi:hypothetical protein